MNLSQLRALVANVLDYSPTNTAYMAEIDQILNDEYYDLLGDRNWAFAQKTAVVTAYEDVVSAVGNVINGSKVVNTVPLIFYDWMRGQVIEIEGVEYNIASVMSATQVYLTEDYAGVTNPGAAALTVKHRHVYLPADCDKVLSVTNRPFTGDADGTYWPMTRREEEEWNVRHDDTGRPDSWVDDGALFVQPPILPPASITNTVGAPTWTAGAYSFKLAHKYAGVYSALSTATSVTAPGAQQITATLTGNSTGIGSGYLLALFCLAPGYDTYRLVLDDVEETGGAATVLTTVPSSTWAFLPRHDESEGQRSRIRLYPRQSEDTEVTVRYLVRPFRLVEDSDVPILPAKDHKLLAHMALVKLLTKHDQPAQAKLYEGRVATMLDNMERHHLPKEARRWVKRGVTLGSPIYGRNWGPVTYNGS